MYNLIYYQREKGEKNYKDAIFSMNIMHSIILLINEALIIF
jgi:hypothetical protein